MTRWAVSVTELGSDRSLGAAQVDDRLHRADRRRPPRRAGVSSSGSTRVSFLVRHRDLWSRARAHSYAGSAREPHADSASRRQERERPQPVGQAAVRAIVRHRRLELAGLEDRPLDARHRGVRARLHEKRRETGDVRRRHRCPVHVLPTAAGLRRRDPDARPDEVGHQRVARPLEPLTRRERRPPCGSCPSPRPTATGSSCRATGWCPVPRCRPRRPAGRRGGAGSG